VQLKTISPNAAASANVPCEAPFPAEETQAAAFSLVALREPILTSCPSDTSLPAIADPTIPDPSTPNFMRYFRTEANYAERETGDSRDAEGSGR